MNDFERRFLSLIQNNSWIATVARQNANIINIEPYTYTTIVGPIDLNASGNNTIQIQSDSDFALTYMSAESVNNAGTISARPVATVQVTDTGTGKTYYSAPTLIPLVFGSEGLPFFLPSPRVIAPNTNLNVQVTSLFGTNATTFYFSFMGARIYYG